MNTDERKMSALEKMRARLFAQDPTLANLASNPRRDISIFQHWEMPVGVSATLRFLPDGNEDNTFFWVQRDMIKLPFHGIKGKPEIKQVVVQVPCMEMYDEECPVLCEVRPWMRDSTLEDMARRYWKKRSYFYQGFVRQSPLHEPDKPINPIRQFIFGPEVHNLVRNMLLHEDLLESPCDYERGMNFTIKKTEKNGYANYDQSYWSLKESAISVDEHEAIRKHGLLDLGTRLPPKPSADAVKVIGDMFTASVDGEMYDPDLWSKYFAPYDA
jgi:hypothetical protein